MLWLSCEGPKDVWEMFSDNSFLSAFLDRQGLQVAAPVDLRTKKAESFSPQLIQGFWQKLEVRIPRLLRCHRLLRRTKSFKKRKKLYGNSTACVWTCQNIKFLAGGAISQEKVPLPMGLPCVATNPSGFSQNLGNLLRGSCTMASTHSSWRMQIKSKSDSAAQAPPYRQYARISNFLDLANLSTQEEAALATNWIKDPIRRVEATEPYVGHQDGPISWQFTEKSNCRRPPRN